MTQLVVMTASLMTTSWMTQLVVMTLRDDPTG